MRLITVKSSLRLTDNQKQKLEKGLKSKEKEELIFEYILDGSVTGVVILDGDRYIDGTYSSELYKIKKNYENVASTEKKGLSVSEITTYFKDKLDTLIDSKIDVETYGKVISSVDGIIKIEGLSTCEYGELLVIGTKGNAALAMNLEKNVVGAILLSNENNIEYGDLAFSSGKILAVPVGESLLGRVVNPLGQALDGKSEIKSKQYRELENFAPEIIDREKVNQPLYTGILAIDSMIPIGKGQRELIIGDRQTGKTSIAIDTILNQAGKDVYCVYVSIGQKISTISKLVRVLDKADALKYTTIVCSTASDNASLQYIAPYAGVAIAEHMMYEGKDVLIVFDDLSKHAVAYREISLLLKRPAGREAYPGDIFYLHSRLLERAAKLNNKKGGGSLTALPIVETQNGDISAYIPTNIISITDGQIYLERELFNAGQRPAINVGLSVSRVGGSAQNKFMNKLSSKIRLELSHYNELKIFSQFGTSIDETTKAILSIGAKTLEAIKQKEHQPLSVLNEEAHMLAITENFLTEIKLENVSYFLQDFYAFIQSYLMQKYKTNTIDSLSKLSEEQIKELTKNASQYVQNVLKGKYEE